MVRGSEPRLGAAGSDRSAGETSHRSATGKKLEGELTDTSGRSFAGGAHAVPCGEDCDDGDGEEQPAPATTQLTSTHNVNRLKKAKNEDMA
jgi:hypothetical protein